MKLEKEYGKEECLGVYWLTMFHGIGVLYVDPYGDYVVSCLVSDKGRSQIRMNNLYYTSTGRSYFRKLNRRIYLDTIMRNF